ncbi:MAG TPA: hypothetical protein VGV35_06085 [Bryobacteraceae bacterium]|nr:hypothetical protein [Bryobacteraceae bacterium]
MAVCLRIDLFTEVSFPPGKRSLHWIDYWMKREQVRSISASPRLLI